MRALIQRVSRCSVSVDGKVVGEINAGLLVLLGIEEADGGDDVSWLCARIAGLRIFNDEQGVMNLSVRDVSGDILLVSQFTLMASTKKGNRPSYIRAAKPSHAVPLYENMIHQLGKETGRAVQTGVFGADMQVELINDGPVTIFIDSKSKE